VGWQALPEFVTVVHVVSHAQVTSHLECAAPFPEQQVPV
jgi:hypothetical protein